MSEIKAVAKTKVAIVTGACSDIGKAIAIALADTGAAIVLSDLSSENLALLKNEMVEKKYTVAAHAADLSTQAAALFVPFLSIRQKP